MHNINRIQYTEYGIYNRSESTVLLFDNELAMIMLFSFSTRAQEKTAQKWKLNAIIITEAIKSELCASKLVY